MTGRVGQTGSIQREAVRWKRLMDGLSEDHPGAAFIQPGRHRYRPMSGADN